MKLHSPRFERALLRAVKREARKSPEKWREWKRSRAKTRMSSFLQSRLFQATSFVGVTLLLASPLVALVMRVPSLPLMAGVLALSVSGISFFQAFMLRATLSSCAPYVMFVRLPVADADVFRIVWRLFVWRSLAFLPVMLVVFCIASDHHHGGAAGLVTGFLVGAMQWQLARGVALIMSLWRWPLQAGCLTLGIIIMLPVLVVAQVITFDRLLDWLESALPWVFLALPSGWLAWLHADFLQHGPGVSLFLLVPVGVVIWLSHLLRRRLMAQFRIQEPVFLTSEGLQARQRSVAQTAATDSGAPSDAAPSNEIPSPELSPESEWSQAWWKQFKPAGPTEIEDNLRARLLFSNLPWSSLGPIERAVERVLTPRERLLAEFMCGRPPQWTRQWRQAWVWLAAGTGAASLIGLAGKPVMTWLSFLFVGLFVLLLGAPVDTGFSRGFQSWVSGSMVAPFHAVFPTGYHEVARLRFKAGAVRTVAAIPLALLFGGFVSWRCGSSVWLGAGIGFKLLVLLLIAQPLFVAFRYSSTTNDTTRFAGTGLVLIPAAIGAFGLFSVLGLTGVFIPHWSAAPLLALAWLVSWGFYRFYGRCYGRWRIDLQPNPRGQTTIG